MNTAIELAILFHETYERLAPQYGYETRPETRVFDPTTPNGMLMLAVCEVIQCQIMVERLSDDIEFHESAWLVG
mgnify:CR=1 FL=1